MKQIKVTTSWDDGHVLDTKLADLLRTYNIAGTFYISPENREISPKDRLTREGVVALSKDFEIGAHTMTHPRLSQVDDAIAKQEIVESKKTLEEWINKPITSFCYPGGDYEARHIDMVRDAGFVLARTVQRFATTIGDPFEMPTTVHAYRHWSDVWNIATFAHFNPVKFFSYYFNWDALAMAMFDRVRETGGVFHLWGHSWEIDRNGDWERLARVLAHISRKDDVYYITNSQII